MPEIRTRPVCEIKSLTTAEKGEVILLNVDSGSGDISVAIFHEQVPELVLQLLKAAGDATQERGSVALSASRPVPALIVTGVEGGHTDDNDVVLSLTIEGTRLNLLLPRSLKSHDGSFLVEHLLEIARTGAALPSKASN
jgi:hypothetical protein